MPIGTATVFGAERVCGIDAAGDEPGESIAFLFTAFSKGA